MTEIPTLNSNEQRERGAYYTPSDAARLMAAWIVESAPLTVLEPSFGGGVFLDEVIRQTRERSHPPTLFGAELDSQAFSAVSRRLGVELRGRPGDFLNSAAPRVDAVIGNPPFIRIRNLSMSQRTAALKCAEEHLGAPMDPSGSTWMPFVLHSTAALLTGGRMALVLPLEITHVRYARPLWTYLAMNFGVLHLVRTRARIFPELLQDVVVLLANNKGGSTNEVSYQVSDELLSLETPAETRTVRISDIEEGRRPFHYCLLPESDRRFLNKHVVPRSHCLEEILKIRIGYVSGDKTYFHPDAKTRAEFKLPPRSLHPTLTSTRELAGLGLWTSGRPKETCEMLWMPDVKRITKGEALYVGRGESIEISKRYKCSVRSPWYVVPGVDIPDVVISVFSERPLMLANDEGFFASNSLICGYLKEEANLPRLLCAWYTSITQLSIELEVHSLGGGVLVAVPRELAKVRIPIVAQPPKRVLKSLDKALSQNDIDAAIGIGDQHLLRSTDFRPTELARVKKSVALLKEWRRSRD